MKQYNINGIDGNGILITTSNKEQIIYLGSIFLERENVILDFFKDLMGKKIMKKTEIAPETFLDLSFKRFEISTIEPGPSTEVVEKRKKELSEERKRRFEAAVSKIEERFGRKTYELVLDKWVNGSKIAIMEVLGNLPDSAKKEDVLFAIKKSLGESPDFLKVMIKLVAEWPDHGVILQAAEKTRAWSYLKAIGLAKYVPEDVRLLGEVVRAFKTYGNTSPEEFPKHRGKIAGKTVTRLKEHFNCTCSGKEN